ncbi:LOW QUALITY PROTEIN: probable methyltransferase TARBP1 [Perognathus longimembris pacificus]|uniref:LOW QUALITY PROTEIN: probable methyltransferase TARBP1 n=1 Tax=Perognathus longimembris pacificus TaxID=214514 RepID=UPI00201877FA|nr:LOW QUALITY PROTEIN: probable methyltransferase TARBP1 [Perognathus longimembris pacificus]
MESVLAELLLSPDRDPRAVLAPLCGGEASAERVEALRFLLQRLEARGAGALCAEAAREVAAGFLVPLLRGRPGAAGAPGPPGPPEPPGRRARVLRAAGAALRSCARLAGAPPLAAALAEEALRELRAGPGGAEAALELLAAVGPGLRPREDAPLLGRVARAAAALALAGDAGPEGAAAARLLAALGRGGGAALRAVWDALAAPAAPAGPGRLAAELQVLSALAERLLPEPGARPGGPDARRCARFWSAVRAGLGRADDALTRRRARFLLRRAVEVSAAPGADRACACADPAGTGPSLFWWSEKKKDELLKFWETYILIMETLEGNQIHVIKPVLPKLNNLFDYAVSEENGCWLFHPSWHVCIYKRMFESENKALTKEGVTHFLELYETKPLPFSPELFEFIIGPLMDALSESSLYGRSPGQPLGSGSPLGLKLQMFLVTYVSLLPEDVKRSFLLKFLQRMTDRHWCAVPILFLSKALASVPRRRALGTEGLLALRDVMQCTMITHQTLLRGAAQCYLLQTAMHLLDVEQVSLSEVSTFLATLRQEESLGRGTTLWAELCEWLHANEQCFRPSPAGCAEPQETSVNAFVRNLVHEYVKSPGWEAEESCCVPDWSEARLTALMVLLAVDVEGRKTPFSETQRTRNVLRIFLDPLLDVLGKLGTNAYVPLLRADRCLQLLLELLRASPARAPAAQDDEVPALLENFILSTTESVAPFILRRLTVDELRGLADLDRCRLHLRVLTQLASLHTKAGWRRGNPVCRIIPPLRNACVRHLQETGDGQEPTLARQIQRAVSMAALAAVWEAADQQPALRPEALEAGPVDSFLSALPLNRTLEKPRAEARSCARPPGSGGCREELPSSSRGWGRIVAQFIHDQWVCLSFLLKTHQALIPASIGPLRAALDALAVLPAGQVSPVFHCLKMLVPGLLASSEPLCSESFDVAWRVTSSSSTTQLTFWPNLKAFVQFVFDDKVLAAAAKIKGQAYLKIKEIMHSIIEMSALRTGVFNVLIAHCCRTWALAARASRGDPWVATSYCELLLEACLFGPVFRRDQRLIQDVQTFIESLGPDCAANVVMESTRREDCYVRICAVKFLCLLDESDVSQRSFMEELAIRLLDKDELAAKSSARVYENSLQHRLKNRTWQTLLVLLPRLGQDFLSGIVERVLRAGFAPGQASVKYSVQWVIVLLLHRFPQFLPSFWGCLSSGEEKPSASVCTFLSVLSHLDVIIENVPEKKPVLKQALAVAVRWCVSHNFSVRLHALVSLKKVWQLCGAMGVDERAPWTSVLEGGLSQAGSSHAAGNASRNWQRVQEHFFFARFHPLEDYCLESVFHSLPRLAGLAEEEWLPLAKFRSFTDLPDAADARWYGSSALRDLPPGTAGSPVDDTDGWAEGANVQKKIIPWRLGALDAELEVEAQDRAARLGKAVGRLVVVASLLDKPTNLGGLCRTCEVFGAAALVVGSLQCVHDPQFQHLSVSAEQWLPLLEVKPAQLAEYLQQKKAEGYTIVGVEQTAKSSELDQYCFPEKSLLLLGNEREGIPARLLQQLDACVEIPQQGVVRSLNVHVSAALLIWEYTRQWARPARAPPSAEQSPTS